MFVIIRVERRQQSLQIGVDVGVSVRVAVGGTVGVMVNVGVKVLWSVWVLVGVAVRVIVGVGLGNAWSTLKLSVFALPHASVLLPYHSVTFTTWFCWMAPVLYIFRPSGTMISLGCGLALGPT